MGIYFITQTPRDIPDGVLSQLGNKIQHALRAYTPSDEKAVKAAANAFRTNPAFDTKEVLTALGTGEALISVPDEDGIPGIVQKCKVLPPQSLMGPIIDEEKKKEVLMSNLYLRYQNMVDRDSAYEFLVRKRKQDDREAEAERITQEEEREAQKRKKTITSGISSVANTAAGTIGRELGNNIGKSIGGSFGKKLGGNIGASLGRSLLGTFLKLK